MIRNVALASVVSEAASPIGADALITNVAHPGIQAVIDRIFKWHQDGCPGVHLRNMDLYTLTTIGEITDFYKKFKKLTGFSIQDYIDVITESASVRTMRAMNKILTPVVLMGEAGTSFVKMIEARLGIKIDSLNKACTEVYGMDVSAYVNQRQHGVVVLALPGCEL